MISYRYDDVMPTTQKYCSNCNVKNRVKKLIKQKMGESKLKKANDN